MEEMRVYVANLGKYNEGELVGDWFEPPIDYDEMAERIGLNEFYEEYAIHDYELPFDRCVGQLLRWSLYLQLQPVR